MAKKNRLPKAQKWAKKIPAPRFTFTSKPFITYGDE
jgi:hypothetical protein